MSASAPAPDRPPDAGRSNHDRRPVLVEVPDNAGRWDRALELLLEAGREGDATHHPEDPHQRPPLDRSTNSELSRASMRLGETLKALREKRGFTQVDLAQRASVTPEYITQLETGARVNPSLDVLKRVAKALGVPVTRLLESR
jgi:DNA-binding XRE family transcriptional regulator